MVCIHSVANSLINICIDDLYSFSHSFNNSINKMNIPSLIFWAVFVLPLVVFLIWLMRQDKRKGVTGLIVVIVTVVAAIVWMYVKTGGN